jgi:hypothetical protein
VSQNEKVVDTAQLREAGDHYNELTRNWMLPLYVINHLDPYGTHRLVMMQRGVDFARPRAREQGVLGRLLRPAMSPRVRYLHRVAAHLAMVDHHGEYLQLITVVDLDWENWK